MTAAFSVKDRPRTLSALAAIPLALVLAGALALPIIQADDPPARGSVDGAARLTLDKMDELTASTSLGQAAVLRGWTQRVEVGTTSIFLHAPYSLEAYAELIGAPKTNVARGQRPLAADAITILLRRR